MTRLITPSSYRTYRPAGPLARYISQYWLSLSNKAPLFTALPDGCIDLVFAVNSTGCQSWVYGTTTRPTDIACTQGSHFLGVRFRPGQSRHFIDAAAEEITDRREDLQALIQLPAEYICTVIATDTLFSQLDWLLTARLIASPPAASYLDHVVQHVESLHGSVRVEDVAKQFGKSRRQLERSFVQTVGVPLKFFCVISRLRHAADLIVQPAPRSLTSVAMDAGYSDQAHMTRDFTRLAGVSPGRLQDDDAFFQYHAPPWSSHWSLRNASRI